MEERRRLLRVHPLQAIAGRVNGEAVYVLDVSLHGVRLCHRLLLHAGTDCFVAFDWDGAPIELTAIVKWTRTQRVGTAAYSRSLYESGTEILIATDRSRRLLRALIEAHVERALDEQKANAKGIPPRAAQSVQGRQSSVFARHEFVNGLWRRMTTNDARQPIYGFTIAAEQPSNEVEMLRAAYTAADDPTRNVIRKLAELSITEDGPIPAQRYTP